MTLLPPAVIGPMWQEQRVALHLLPPDEARAETVFLKRRYGYRSSALTAFISAARTAADFQT